MNFLHSIELKESFDEVCVRSLASNDFIDENNCNIVIYLENFKFRKNVNCKKVAKQMNKYFLYELICAISRKKVAFETGNLNYTICGHGGFNCSCSIDFIIRTIEGYNKCIKKDLLELQ